MKELSISEIQQAFADASLTSEELTERYLQRIDELRAMNAVRETNPDAKAIAADRDRERRAGKVRSPLHGVPVLLKDNMGTADAMRTTAGVKAMADLRTPFDAGLVKRLRQAGAVILGKCSCPDFCDYMASTMPSSFSATAGEIAHPYPGIAYGRGGGSSTGVAAAVAANLAAVGVGSETQNSIQAPCGHSSLVGIKPTVGLISRAGMVPLATSQDTAGPIARTVRDAATLLSVLAGPDHDDTFTYSALGAVHADYSRFCADSTLVGARIGVPRQHFFGRDGKAGHDAAVNKALAALHEAGAEIVDPADIPNVHFVMPMLSRVFRTDFKAGLNAFLASCGERSAMKSMAEIVRYNEKHPEAIPFGQDLLLAAQATQGDWTEPEYHSDRARDIRLTRAEGIDAVLSRHRLDALVVPMDHASKFTGKAGYPAVTVPCGYTEEGAPVGLTFIGTAWSEPRLIGIAHAFEQLATWRRPPGYGSS